MSAPATTTACQFGWSQQVPGQRDANGWPQYVFQTCKQPSDHRGWHVSPAGFRSPQVPPHFSSVGANVASSAPGRGWHVHATRFALRPDAFSAGLEEVYSRPDRPYRVVARWHFAGAHGTRQSLAQLAMVWEDGSIDLCTRDKIATLKRWLEKGPDPR